MGAQGSLFRSPPRDPGLRVGPAGWNYKDWEGIVYPPGAGKSFDPLAYLADYCDTIEINSSFYAPPRPEDAAGWARRVRNNPRFRFTAKAWKQITHDRGREDAAGSAGADGPALRGECEQVRRSMAPLADAGLLGALLVQFPWSFRRTPENLDYLEAVLRMLSGFPVVVEVRHGSWEREEADRFLAERGAGFCNVDQPVIGESLRPAARVTSRVGYIRMHGRNYANWFREGAGRDARYDYLYSKAEIGQISGLIRTIRQEAEETYAIMNNHFRGQALVNAIEILQELDAERPAVPPTLAAAYPRLLREP